MLVLGIDPGTATTGFGFVREEEDGEIVAVHYGVVSTQAGVPMPKRLQKLYVDLTDLIAQYKPDEGAIEEMFFGKNITAAITVLNWKPRWKSSRAMSSPGRATWH